MTHNEITIAVPIAGPGAEFFMNVASASLNSVQPAWETMVGAFIAWEAGNEYRPQTASTGNEFGGKIYCQAGTCAFTVVEGVGGAVNINAAPAPAGSHEIATWHTHTSSPSQSMDDYRSDQRVDRVNGFIATPQHTLVIDPYRGDAPLFFPSKYIQVICHGCIK